MEYVSVISPDEIDDSEAKAAAQAAVEKNPNLKLFYFECCDRSFVGKRVSNNATTLATTQSANPQEKNPGAIVATFIQQALVHPKFAYQELDGLHELSGGEITEIFTCLLAGNGYDTKSDRGIKNLYGRPAKDSSATTS